MELPASITNYIDSLGDVEHERLLTTKLIPGHIFDPFVEIAGCLVGVARGCCDGMKQEWSAEKKHLHARDALRPHLRDWDEWTDWGGDHPHEYHWQAFNRLARLDREGTESAIRAYIRGLRATRALIEEVTAAQPEEVTL